jgi:hypothetical protein
VGVCFSHGLWHDFRALSCFLSFFLSFCGYLVYHDPPGVTLCKNDFWLPVAARLLPTVVLASQSLIHMWLKISPDFLPATMKSVEIPVFAKDDTGLREHRADRTT